MRYAAGEEFLLGKTEFQGEHIPGRIVHMLSYCKEESSSEVCTLECLLCSSLPSADENANILSLLVRF